MKICAISDIHGEYDFSYIENDTELLLIAGDVVDLYVQKFMGDSEKWFKKNFIDMMSTLNDSVKKVVMIAGNHDFYLERYHSDVIDLFKENNIVFLNNSLYEYESESGQKVSIFGTPYCNIFGNWAYMLSYEKLKKKFDNIPYNVDILLSHDAPYGTNDVCLQDVHWVDHSHIGNKALAEAILEKKPKWNIHGHLHSASHIPEKLGDTNVVNVSMVDERYINVYNPFYFEL